MKLIGNRARRAGIVAVVGAMSLALAACGSSSGSSGGGSAKKVSGNVLTLAVDAPPDTLNPAIGGAGDPFQIYYELDYDPLIYLSSSGKYVPGLATKWGYVGSGNRVFDLTLRKGVKFSDGASLSAKGVKAFFAYYAKAGGAQASRVQNFKSVTVTGPLSLKITLKTPDPELPYYFTQDEGSGDIISPKALGSSSLSTASDGAGQYVLNTAQTVSKQTYVFDANPHYWNPKAVHWKEIKVEVLTNPSAVLDAMRTGQVDYTIASPSQVAAAKSAGLQVVDSRALYGFVDLYDLAGKQVKALGSRLVREALNYAINRPAMMKGLYGKYGQAADEIQLPGTSGYVSSLANYYDYNPTKAKKLLAEAGYPNGFSMTLGAYNVEPGVTELAQAVASYWQAIGVKVTLNVPVNTNGWAANVLGGKYPAATFEEANQPMYAAASGYLTPHGFFNPLAYVTPQITSALAKAAVAGPAQSTAADDAIQQMLVKQAFYVPFGDIDKVVLARPGLTGVKLSANQLDPDPVFFNRSK